MQFLEYALMVTFGVTNYIHTVTQVNQLPKTDC